MKLFSFSIAAIALTSQFAMAQFSSPPEASLSPEKIIANCKGAVVSQNLSNKSFKIKYTLDGSPVETQSCVKTVSGGGMIPNVTISCDENSDNEIVYKYLGGQGVETLTLIGKSVTEINCN